MHFLFSDGKKMISRSGDETIRRWDLPEGKEIEEARVISECAQALVLRDGSMGCRLVRPSKSVSLRRGLL
ncbi:hypothetical protein P692DRAFT_20839855 [Suillus brevipes Sb2]|nr:hypothetical protein P692DRAFT_20839855 [Suillus brevipes Sb2]